MTSPVLTSRILSLNPLEVAALRACCAIEIREQVKSLPSLKRSRGAANQLSQGYMLFGILCALNPALSYRILPLFKNSNMYDVCGEPFK